MCAVCRAERAQRLGRNGSDQPASPPRADPGPPSAKGGPFRREDGEIVGESPSTSKRHAEAGRQQAGRYCAPDAVASLMCYSAISSSLPSPHPALTFEPSSSQSKQFACFDIKTLKP